MRMVLYTINETEDEYLPDEVLGEVILQEDGEFEIAVDDEELADELFEFFEEPREVRTGDPTGRLMVNKTVELEPGTVEHFKACMNPLLEEFDILARVE